MQDTRVWAIRAGSAGQADQIFIEQEHVALSCAEMDADASSLPPTRGAFKEAFRSGADEDLAAGSAAGGFNNEAAGQVCDTGGKRGVVG